MKKLLLFTLSIVFFGASYAQLNYQAFNGHNQTIPERCGTMAQDALARANNPWMGTLQAFKDQQALQISQQSKQSMAQYMIPVIVHVIHNGETVGTGTNISLAQINSQIDVLNADYARLNADTVNTPAQFQSVAASTGMQFCMALVDTNGTTLPEPGVNRIDRNVMGWNTPPYTNAYITNPVQPATYWKPDEYFNIWVIDLTGGLLAFASLPGGADNVDGVVIDPSYFGTIGTTSPFNLGRVATHETGHWLGLLHIWEGGCASTDNCADTPPQAGASFGCPSFPLTDACTGTSPGVMFMNYMDYTDDACMNMFSDDQRTIMQNTMATANNRMQLASSPACSCDPVIAVNSTPVSCFGANNGTATATVTGGLSPYNYLWSTSPAQTNATATGLVAGVYQVTVTTADTCTSTNIVAVNSPATLQATLATTHISCIGNDDGSISVSASGGTSPYTYIWSTAQTTSSISGLTNTSYTVTVTDNNSCTVNVGDSIIDPSLLVGTVDSTININCNGAADGIVYANASGGTPFTLSYDTTFFENFDLGMPGGFTLLNLDTLTPSLSVADIQEAWDIRLYSGDSVAVSTSWYTPPGTANDWMITPAINLTDNNTLSWGAVALDPTYTDGYEVRISTTTPDTAGCMANAPLFSIAAENTNWTDRNLNLDSMGYANQTVYIAFRNNSVDKFLLYVDDILVRKALFLGLYEYSLDTGATFQNDSIFTGLSPGSYQVIARDANGCTSPSTFTLTEPAGITGSSNASICGNDSILLGGSYQNAAGSYSDTYTASNGCDSIHATQLSIDTSYVMPASASICFEDSILLGGSYQNTAGVYNDVYSSILGCDSTESTTLTIDPAIVSSAAITICDGDSVLIDGTYQSAPGAYVDVYTASNGCDSTETTTLTVNSVLVLTYTSTADSGSSQGTINLTVSGGTPPYSYAWSNAASSEDLTNLTTGFYTVTVTDSIGCSDTLTAMVGTAGCLMTSSLSSTTTSCDQVCDASATVTAIGGAAPYFYLWSDGSAQSNSTAIGLCVGTYNVTVTDSNLCVLTDSAIISSAGNISVGTSSLGVPCIAICEGAATVIASGGTTPYTYTWDDPNTQTNSIAIALCTGSYSVMVVDSAGCSGSASVTIGSQPEVSLVLTTTNAACNSATGSASVVASNGTTPFSYQWSSGATQATSDSLSSGIYLVTVTDASGCTATIAATISDADGPSFSNIFSTDISCNGGDDGAISTIVSGGATPYTYLWSNGGTAAGITNLVAGPYEINVLDSAGCIAVSSVTLTEPSALALTTLGVDATCGSSDGSVSVTTTGGTSGYAYLWSSGGTSSSETGLSADAYSVTVTDANGCTETAVASVSDIGGPTITIDSIIDGGCGADLGSIFISNSGGQGTLTTVWSDSSTSEDLVDVSAGTYSVVVTDTAGCVATQSAVIQGIPTVGEVICLVTVDSITGMNMVIWEKNQTVGVVSYNIYKESTQAGVYFNVGNVLYTELSEFVDSVSNPLQRPWSYKLVLVDQCGTESTKSDVHKTIHLTINKGLGNNYNLIWSPYVGYSFSTYYVHRFRPSEGWVLLDSVPSTVLSYTDFSVPQGEANYYIETRHPDGCTSSKVKNWNSSKSNTSSISAEGTLDLIVNSGQTSTGSCFGEVSVSPSGGTAPYTYLWDDPAAQTTDTAAGLCIGNYTVTVIDADGNTMSASTTVSAGVNISELSANYDVQIAPNPFSNSTTLTFVNDRNLSFVVKVYDNAGRIVRRYKNIKTNSVVIERQDLNPGIYHFTLEGPNGKDIGKLIVQ